METRDTISEWADAAFGTMAGSPMRMLARVNEEMAELLRAITSDEPPAKIAEEAADVVITITRYARHVGVDIDLDDQRPSSAWQTSSDIPACAIDAAHYMADLLLFQSRDAGTAQFAHFFPHFMAVICLLCGTTLRAEVERKMVINRAREWRRDGTGHGYHVTVAEPE